ncbi:hypothetical protein FF1_035000 [Malus domestica]
MEWFYPKRRGPQWKQVHRLQVPNATHNHQRPPFPNILVYFLDIFGSFVLFDFFYRMAQLRVPAFTARGSSTSRQGWLKLAVGCCHLVGAASGVGILQSSVHSKWFGGRSD